MPETEKQLANRQIAASDWFIDLCSKVDVKPTRRQVSKYRDKRGSAYRKNQTRLAELVTAKAISE